jgi:transposase
MRGRPFRIAWQVEESPAQLKAAYQAEARRELRPRLHALWLLRTGWSLRAVADALGVHYRTVQRWVAWYRQGGRAAVVGHRQAGRGQPAFLTADQQAQLAAQVATGRFPTAAEIRQWVADEFGVTYTEGGMYALLARLRCAPKVPRPLQSKADLQEQVRFKGGDSAPRWRRSG